MYEAVWGNGYTAVAAGVLGEYASREEAEARCREFLRDHADTTALGAWIREAAIHEAR